MISVPNGRTPDPAPVWRIGELVTAALVGTAVALILSGVSVPPAKAVTGGILTTAMTLICLIDLRLYKIPDLLSLPAIPLGLLATGSLVDSGAEALVAWESIAGMLAGGTGLYLLGYAYRVLRGRVGVGLGDVKLMAATGAWVGLSDLPLTVLTACVGALTVALAQRLLMEETEALAATRRVPFGAYLAAATLVVWISGAILTTGIADAAFSPS